MRVVLGWLPGATQVPALVLVFILIGALVNEARLLDAERPVSGMITATRGNHGQSLAYAGRAHGIPVTIVVPEGNSPDKNAAMEGFGAEWSCMGATSRRLASTRFGTACGTTALVLCERRDDSVR